MGELPKGKGLGYVQRLSYAFRRALEGALAERNSGRVASLYEASLIDTASRHHRNALLAHKWFREQYADLTATERLRFVDKATEYATARDAAIAKLGLAGPATAPGGDDAWDAAMKELRARSAASGNLFSPAGVPTSPAATAGDSEGGDE
jgi:hypothetical protein